MKILFSMMTGTSSFRPTSSKRMKAPISMKAAKTFYLKEKMLQFNGEMSNLKVLIETVKVKNRTLLILCKF